MSETNRKLNRVAKWRTLFAGWQLGTRPKGDPECEAVRDHRELSILLRVEVTALTGLLLRKGVITQEEISKAVGEEADYLSEAYEKTFPGVKATDSGLTFDLEKIKAAGTMQGWKP